MAFETEYTSHLLRSFCHPRRRNGPNGSGVGQTVPKGSSDAGQTVPKGSVRFGAIRAAGNDRQKHQKYLRSVERRIGE